MLRIVWIATALWLSAALPVRAAEIAEQIPPKDARLQPTGNWLLEAENMPGNPALMFLIETTTIGRAKDTGFSWEVWIPNRGPAAIYWQRIVTDCKTRRYYIDWVAITGLDGKVGQDGAGERIWHEIFGMDKTQAYERACLGKPLPNGKPMTLVDAFALARSIQNP